MRAPVKILRIGVLLSFVSLVAVVALVYYFEKTVILDPYVMDPRLVGLSYEIVVDLYGPPGTEEDRVVTWEDGQNRVFLGMDMYFPLMQPGDSVLIKRLIWKCGEGRRRDVHLYWDGYCWKVFHSVEGPDIVEWYGPY